ncbi:MAG: hypothetical protein OIN66_01590, partial [Candidatus Methanoperedens sp.]|nr:hypothetical protein [Candidatus Methanoperedens sp.]
FSIWTDTLSENDAASKLLPEIFSDTYMAIHFAAMGLYKYANMCLRSELENTLRLVFFSTHPVEFKWWSEGKKIFGITGKKHVWGDDYRYFENLEKIKIFDSKVGSTDKLFIKVQDYYNTLSSYVHTSSSSFQTRPGSISPKYQIGLFSAWYSAFNKMQDNIHIILILTFFTEFKSASQHNQDDIITNGINYQNYKEKILEIIQAP